MPRSESLGQPREPAPRPAARATVIVVSAIACLVLASGCGTRGWGVREPVTLGDIGDGILGIGTALGGAVGLNALHDAGGGNSRFGPSAGDDGHRSGW